MIIRQTYTQSILYVFLDLYAQETASFHYHRRLKIVISHIGLVASPRRITSKARCVEIRLRLRDALHRVYGVLLLRSSNSILYYRYYRFYPSSYDP